jgi:putative acetyltransferase
MKQNTLNNWSIRPFCHDDAVELSRIYRAAVQRLAAVHYTPDQIAVWLSIAPKPQDFASIYRGDRTAVVCVGNGLIVGFSDHDTAGHIRFLYCHPNNARQGVARVLLDAVEASARHAGIKSLTSEASEVALPVFARHGFRTVERRDFAIDGVAIHNFAVEKCLLSISPRASQGYPSE